MSEKGSNWFVKGCLGCLGLILVFVVLIVLLMLWAAQQASRPAHMETREVVKELPPLVLPEGAAEGGLPAELGELGAVELPAEIPAESAPQALTLELDLSIGDFEVEPGPPGEPIRVEAEYDANRFRLEESWDEESRLFRVKFASQSGAWFQFGRQGNDTRLRVIVPRDYPVNLQGSVGVGRSRMELGGLWLTDVNLDFSAGDHRVEISEPLRAAVESFRMAGSVGEIELAGLGNASPREVKISHSAGEVDLDLTGAWQRDAEIDVDLGFGECMLRLPSDVWIDLDSARMGVGEVVRRDEQDADLPEDAPRLAIEVSGSVGELVVQNR